MMRRFTVSLLQRLVKTNVTCQIQSQSHRSLFSISEKSYRYLGPSLLDVPASQGKTARLIMFSPMQRQQNAHFSSPASCRKEIENENQLEVEIISSKHIKPASPTPKHLRTYELSLFDQITPAIYMPFVYFYSNDRQNYSKMRDQNDLTLRRRQLLKQSLSETLTRFYPLAGKIKDYRHIDCNDDGVYCVEANVSQILSDFLSQPGNKCVQPLLPFGYNFMELLSKTNVLMIQLTTFSCGGISIGLCASHKIIDGSSYATFLKAWAATASAGEEICPQFISPLVFPSAPAMPESMSLDFTSLYVRPGNNMKRFVFHASSLTQLKSKGGASRVLAVTGLIWKCAIKALKARSTNVKKISCLSVALNLRERSLPPMPLYSMGNIRWSCHNRQCSEDVDIELESLVGRLKHSIKKIDGNFVEAMKGENGSHRVWELFNEAQKFYSDESNEHLIITSMCNSGMYETDFGWGKPTWVSFGIGGEDPRIPGITNFVVLMDTKHGNGIEAWVSLSNEDMSILERDPELLQMASVDPSPLID